MISRTEPIGPAVEDAGRHVAAFTLVEILLVVAIITIATLVTIPTLVRSIRGNRLRTAASSIVRANQYARAMALLRQQEAVLGFDISNATISVTFPDRALSAQKQSTNAEERAVSPEPSTAEANPAEQTAEETPRTQSGGQNPNVTRVLDGVAIEYVELEEAGRKTDGLITIIYQTNGRCEPFKVRVVDARGEGTTIAIDDLATATTSD